MKTILMIIIVGFTINVSLAQRLTGDRVIFSYKEYPAKPIPPRYTKFLVRSIIDGEIDESKTDRIKSHLSINGYTQAYSVSNTDDFFKIEFSRLWNAGTETKFTSTTRTVNRGSKKGKNSKKTNSKKIKYYQGTRLIDIKLPYKILGYVSNGEKKFQQLQTGIIEAKKEVKSKEYRSKASVNADLNKKYMNVYNAFKKEFYGKTISNYFNNRLSFKKVTHSFKFFTVKKFKRFDYSDLNNAKDIAINAAKTFRTSENINNYKTDIQPAIDIWNKALSESNLNTRKTRVNKKVTCVVYYNLIHAYYMMQDYDKALDYIDKLSEINSSFKLTQMVKANAIKCKSKRDNYFKIAGISAKS